MIVRPSAMQQVAATLATTPSATPPTIEVAVRAAIPATSVQPLRFAELTPSMIGALKILRALEVTYPQCGDRASRTLEGHEAWRMKQGRVMNSKADHQDLSPSRDLAHAISGVRR